MKENTVEKIPLSSIVNEFKGEAAADERAKVEAWLKGDESHGDVYMALKSLWDALMIEGMNYKSAADELWKRQEGIYSGKSAAKEYIRFERKPLSYVARHLSKWYGVDIVVDRSVPDNQAYTFVVKKEPIDEILRLMARISPIRYDYGEDNTVNIYNNN